jgi:hypothetical protein
MEPILCDASSPGPAKRPIGSALRAGIGAIAEQIGARMAVEVLTINLPATSGLSRLLSNQYRPTRLLGKIDNFDQLIEFVDQWPVHDTEPAESPAARGRSG